jgi:hypothetical protein
MFTSRRQVTGDRPQIIFGLKCSSVFGVPSGKSPIGGEFSVRSLRGRASTIPPRASPRSAQAPRRVQQRRFKP